MTDDPMLERVGLRFRASLQEAETHWLAYAAHQATAYRAILQWIAETYCAHALENEKQKNPNTVSTWEALTWHRFLQTHLAVGLTEPRLLQKIAWLETALETTRRKLDAAQTALAHTQGQLADAQAQLAEQETTLAAQAAHRAYPPPQVAPQENAPPAENTPPPQALVSHATVLAALGQFVPPQLPVRYAALGQNPAYWKRGALMLFLLARFGLNSRVELGYLLAQHTHITLNSGSGKIRRAGEYLAEKGLVQAATVTGKGRPRMSLALYALTEEGQTFCRLLGWPVVESEWTRINRLHEGARFPQHTLGLLSFTMYARRRAWQTAMLPEVPGHAIPDVYLCRGEAQHYVEVELSRKENLAKWKNLQALQGHVALCAGTESGRKRLVGDCKMKQFPGVATDLDTLKRTRLPDREATTAPLWLERW